MNRTLYSEQFEHDACGIGAVVSIDGIASHQIVSDALTIVERLEHRAGKDATGEVGDGVGVLLQICHPFFAGLGFPLGKKGDYGVGMFFLPQDSLKRREAQKLLEVVCRKEGVPFLGWRQVPVVPEVLGARARESMPAIYQCALWPAPPRSPKGWTSTGSCTSSGGCLSRAATPPMCAPSLPGRWCTRACSW